MRNKKVMAAVVALVTVATITIPVVTRADTSDPVEWSAPVSSYEEGVPKLMGMVLTSGVTFDPANVSVYARKEESNVPLSSGSEINPGDVLVFEGVAGKTLTGFKINGDEVSATGSLEYSVPEGTTAIYVEALYASVSEDVSLSFDAGNIKVSIVTDSGNASVESSGVVGTGSVLILEGIDGKTLKGFLINDIEVSTSQAYEYTIPEGVASVSVEALYENSTVTEGTIPVNFSADNVLVSIKGQDTNTPITSGTPVKVGDVLIIEGIEGKTLTGVIINNTHNTTSVAAEFTVPEGMTSVTVSAVYEGDTEGDGIVVSFNAGNVKVSVKGEEENTVLASGDSVKAGDVLVLEGVGDKVLKSLIINGVEKTVGGAVSEFTVPSDWVAATIEATYSDESVPTKATVSFSSDNVKVSLIGEEGNTPLEPNAQVDFGSKLLLEGVRIEGKKLIGFKVNGDEVSATASAEAEIPSGLTSVSIEALYEDAPVIEGSTITYDEDAFWVTKTSEGSLVRSGDKVAQNEMITIIVKDGVDFTGVKVNGNTISLSKTTIYTVSDDENTEITVFTVRANTPVTYDSSLVTVTSNDGSALPSGSKVSTGYELTITAADISKTLTGITVNGTTISETSPVTYTVLSGDEKVEISAIYEGSTSENAIVTFDEDLFWVNRLGSSILLNSGDKISKDDMLVITVKDNVPFAGIKVNGKIAGYSKSVICVVSDNTNVEIELLPAEAKTTITYDSSNVTVKGNGNVLPSGTKLSSGYELEITGVENGKESTGISVNGTLISYTGTATYTVKADDEELKIAATYKDVSPAVASLTYDSSIVTITDANHNTIANGSTVSSGDKLTIVAKTTTNERLTGIKVNGEVVSTTNGYEYTVPSGASEISVEATYATTGYGSSVSGQISTYSSDKVEISCNSDEVDMFVDQKPVYGDLVLDKASNTKVYFSIIEAHHRGKVTAVRYNGQRIKPRGYFFIDINEFTFDHIVIEIEYENSVT